MRFIYLHLCYKNSFPLSQRTRTSSSMVGLTPLTLRSHNHRKCSVIVKFSSVQFKQHCATATDYKIAILGCYAQRIKLAKKDALK